MAGSPPSWDKRDMIPKIELPHWLSVYGGAVREALTTQGQLRTIIDFSDAQSFETSADAYPHFFVFQKDKTGPTKIRSMAGDGSVRTSGKPVERTFLASP
jgi:hypothetical protein